MSTTARKALSPTSICAIAVSALALVLVLAPQATPARQPLITLGPITVANGTATVTGTLETQLIGAAVAANGQPLGVDAAGHFSGVIDLNGGTALDLALTRPHAATLDFGIPLPPAGVVPGSILDDLLNAGLSVMPPVLKGGTVTVSGSLLDLSQLGGLTVNGIDVLRLLGNGLSFSVGLPGNAKVVTVLATDSKSVSETVALGVTQQTTVAATAASGLRIAKIRYVKKGVLRTHRAHLIVTVKDARGLLVKGATIVVRAKGHRLARRPGTAHSGAKGRATIKLRLRGSAYGKRLVTITAVRTPSAKARKTTATLIPRRKKR